MEELLQLFLFLWKAPPLGGGATEGEGGGKPGTKEPLHSDKQALCQSDTIAV